MCRSEFRTIVVRYPLFLLSLIYNVILHAQPVITGFSPASGPIGTTVTILGQHFNATPQNNTVWFGAVKANVTAGTTQSLTVAVPPGANYHPITVTTAGRTAWSALPFAVTFVVADTAFHPEDLASRKDYPAGSFATYIANIDFNGDGRSDIVTSNYTDKSVSIFRNTSTSGNLSFITQQKIAVPDRTTYLDAGDLDGDGLPDLAVTCERDKIVLLRNSTVSDSITFSADTTLTSDIFTQGVAIRDLDGDGLADIAVMNNQSSNHLTIFRNTSTPGHLSFAGPVNIASSATQHIVISDLDGDGKPELIASGYGVGTISIFKNNCSAGIISFANEMTVPVDMQPYNVAVGDLDGDGKIDVLTGNSAYLSSMSILRNISSGGTISFAPHVDIPVNQTPYGICIADLDGDGKPEIVQGNNNNAPSTFSVYKNACTPGNIAFRSHIDYSCGDFPAFITAGDFDNDGKIDIATANNLNISVLRNQVNVLSQKLPVISSISPSSGPVGTTVTIRGRSFDPQPGKNIVWFGAAKAEVLTASDSVLTTKAPAGSTYQPISVTVNNLVASSSSAFGITFPGAPAAFDTTSFDLHTDTIASDHPTQLALIDFDGDGKTDLVAANDSNHTISVYRNISTARKISYGPALTLATGSGYYTVATGDFDMDGKPDLAISAYDVNDSLNLVIYRNTSSNGSLSFSSGLKLFTGYPAMGLAIADLDADDKPDLICVTGNDKIFVFRNLSSSPGIINMSPPIAVAEPKFLNGLVAVMDIDGDGLADLIIGSAPSGLGVRRNISKPGRFDFEAAAYYLIDDHITDLTVADINGDGKQDIVTIDYTARDFTILRNDIASSDKVITFTKITSIPVTPAPLYLAVSDVDGDSRPDFVLSGSGDPGSVAVLKNISSGNNINVAKTVNYLPTKGPSKAGVADLDGDSKPDLAISNSIDNIFILRNSIAEPYITPSGTSPVQGPLSRLFSLDSNVSSYNGVPYVPRHYDIEPADNPSGATATVTLFFTQKDFDRFNAAPGHTVALPATPTDTAGISNLRIFQYHGTSSTHLPGSYSGDSTTIDPIDSLIKWDPTTEWWKVTFDVKGFSGFFAGVKRGLITAVDDVVMPGDIPLRIYPNPAAVSITIDHPSTSKEASIFLIDMTGRVIKTLIPEKNSPRSTIYVSELPAGIYNIVWRSRSTTYTRSFMVTHSQ